MEPFLNYIRIQNPSLQYWKVGVLHTAPRSPSQYGKMDWQLHSDYSEEVLLRPECKQPMSLIIALDNFEFVYELDNEEDEDEAEIKTMTVHGMQAIAVTNELFHAGGENKMDKTLYHLFVYIVSHHADFPNGTVFTRNKSNVTKLEKERRRKREEQSFEEGTVSGRNRK